MPKQVHKRTQTVKHKKSKAKADRIAQKMLKVQEQSTTEMSTEDAAVTQLPQTEEEKDEAKLIRKKAHAQKNSYKRIITKTKHFK